MSLDHLFQPFRIGSLDLKNRLIMAPMHTGYSNHDGTVSQRDIDYFVARARGGVGLITMGVAYVDPAGRIHNDDTGISDDRFIPGLRKLTQAVHDAGGRISIQLSHGGRYCRSQVLGFQPAAPSAVYSKLTDETPRPMSTEEVEALVAAFASAGKRARDAGFDAIELCACTGYAISQFLSPVTNKREDRFGGSPEKRLTFLTDILRQTRALVGPAFPICCKLSVDELVPGGNTAEDTCRMAPEIVAAGATMLHAWAGWHESAVPMIQSSVSPGAWVYLAEMVKKVVDVPVVAVGRITDPVLADRILSEGRSDLVAMGRALIADPELPNKAREGRFADIRHCIACNRCFDSSRSRLPIACSVNAASGREGQCSLTVAEKPRKVVVIGGGPAGMEAARIAAARKHDVTLWEQESSLGGTLNVACVPPNKDDIRTLNTFLQKQLNSLGVKVELNRHATVKDVERAREAGTAVVVATGALPIVPRIPMAPNKAVAAIDVLSGKAAFGQKVVILGGGAIGCELAEFLKEKGKDVVIVEMLKRIGADIGISTRWVILSRLRKLGVETLTETRGIEITEAGLVVEKEGVRSTLEADTVVIAVGMRPSRDLVGPLAGAPGVYFIGDCVEAKRIFEAVHAGFDAGLRV